MPALTTDPLLLEDPDDASDRGADEDPRAGGIDALDTRVRPRLTRRSDGEHDVPLEPARVLRAHHFRRVETLDLRRDAHGELARVEGADPVDAARAGDGGIPRRLRVEPQGRDGSETGDDDAAHEHESVVAWSHGSIAYGPSRARRAAVRPPQSHPVPADGGRARPRPPRRRRVAVRAEMGRVPRPARERDGGAAPVVAERTTPPALLPRAAPAREAAAAAFSARRGDRHRARRRPRFRCDADTAPSGRESREQALRGDPSPLHRIRRPRLEGRRGLARPLVEAPNAPGAEREAVRALARHA